MANSKKTSAARAKRRPVVPAVMVRLSQELYEQVRQAAEEDVRSMGSWVQVCIRDALERRAEEDREAAR